MDICPIYRYIQIPWIGNEILLLKGRFSKKVGVMDILPIYRYIQIPWIGNEILLLKGRFS